MTIRPIGLSDLDPLVSLALGDGHSVVRPTHIALQGDEPLGYASIAAVPLVIFYMHTQKAKALNTFRMERYCEDVLRKSGMQLVCAPCSPASPIYPYMGKMGFTSYGNMDMFLKPL
jgi:hypothetical protein